jgi:curli biogenesis system outer membrane secretion channel CsgG
MAKKICFLLLFALLISCGAVFPALGAPPDNRLRVAILPFDDGSIQGRERWWGRNWEVGRGVADELVTALFDTGQFRLIERDQIEKVLAEQHMVNSGQINPRTAARLGRILGVQVLILGKVTEFSNDSTGAAINTPRGFGFGIRANTARVTLDARMVDTTSAEILATASGHGEKKQTSFGLRVDFTRIDFGSNEFRKTNLGIALKDAVANLAEQLAAKDPKWGGPPPPPVHPNPPPEPPAPLRPVIGKVTTVYKDQVYIDVGSADGVRTGMDFKVYKVIDIVNENHDGKILFTEPIAMISVVSVKRENAICTINSRIDFKFHTAVNDFVRQTE